jgi:multiple sugar transport system permease protein
MATESLTPGLTRRGMGLSEALRSRQITPYYYLLPTIVPLLILTVYPFLRAFWLGFTDYNLFTKDATFVGLANFVKLIGSDNLFWVALRNNLTWTIGIVLVTYLLGLPTALALNENFRFRSVFRGIALIPWVCPAVVAGLTWQFIYEPNFGPLNYFLQQVGLIDHNVGWLSSRTTALYSAMVVAIWKLLPFMTVMLLAGLQAIPGELLEAAQIDGAGTFARLRFITLPLLNRVGSIAILLSTIWAFNHFDSLYVLTGGGPGNATMLLSILSYQNAFAYSKVGYASAIGIIMMIVLVVPITLYIRRVIEDT